MNNVDQVQISKEEFELLMLGFMGVSAAPVSKEDSIINLHKAVENKMEICTGYRRKEMYTLQQKMVTMKLVSMFLSTLDEDVLNAQCPSKTVVGT